MLVHITSPVYKQITDPRRREKPRNLERNLEYDERTNNVAATMSLVNNFRTAI